jgi:tripartite-type tricarboxylate transporter receptor subunit TctC
MMKRSIALIRVGTALILATLAGAVAAQKDYPTRPIRLVVPYPPGGSVDYLARLYGPKMTELLGRQIIVDNRGGGNTIIGNDIVAKSNPDGYTLLVAGAGQIAISQLYRKIPYDVIKDFMPIAGIARAEFILVVNPALPVHSVRDLIALAKQRPGELNYGTSSTGGATHLGPVQFQILAGVKMQQVPYKGGGPAMTDLLAGQTQLGFASPGSSMPFIRTGRLRAVAVTGDSRLEALPEVPTFTEAGLPGLRMANWYSITSPGATPRPIIDKLAAAILTITTLPEIKSAIVRQGFENFSATSDQVDAMRRDDLIAVRKLYKAANIKPID